MTRFVLKLTLLLMVFVNTMPLYAGVLKPINPAASSIEVIQKEAHPCHQDQHTKKTVCQQQCEKGQCSHVTCPHIFYSLLNTQNSLLMDLTPSSIFISMISPLPKNTNSGIERPPKFY